LEGIGLGGEYYLEVMVKKKVWESGLDVFSSEQAQTMGFCEQGNDMDEINQKDQQMHFGFINVILLYSGIVQ
jgi:hypothetical protein